MIRVPEEEITIFAERPDKPFDRDTEVRLTGEELVERGATDLATALALIPDVTVRDAGRGGVNVDIRGARKGSVTVMIDGVVVSDPFYGTFDASTIPVTDIVQIRVSTTPQSPIDGPGGPGGVIEVHTRDAAGPQLVVARIVADTSPALGITGTARVPLSRRVGLRVSASGLGGRRELELPGDATIGERRRAATGSARLEYRDGDRRVLVDGFVDDRSYLAPPAYDTRSNFLLIDRETTARGQIRADDKIGTLQLQGAYWVHYLHRRSRQFPDPQLVDEIARENLQSIRSGGMLLATRPFKKDYRWVTSLVIDHAKALVFDLEDRYSRGRATSIELAVGLQYERNRLRIDGATGHAMPFGVDAAPWPEAKLTGRYRLAPTRELAVTTGYKGRLPSLRERFERQTGNPSLEPEKAFHVEVRAIETRERWRLDAAPFYRRVDGTIRTSLDPMNPRLVNLGVLDVVGIDLSGRVQLEPRVELGGAYSYVRATSDDSDEPLDRLPRHRTDTWLRGKLGSYRAMLRGRYFGPSIDRGARVRGYGVVEATASAQLGSEYVVTARLDDALDARPESRAGYRGPGRTLMVILQGAWD